MSMIACDRESQLANLTEKIPTRQLTLCQNHQDMLSFQPRRGTLHPSSEVIPKRIS